MSPTLGRREDGSWARRGRHRPFRAAAGVATLLVLLLGSAVLAAGGTTSSTPTDGRAGDRRSPIAPTQPRPDAPPLAAGWAEIVIARLPDSVEASRRAAAAVPDTGSAASAWPPELASRPTASAPMATARSEPKPPPGRIRARGVATWYCLSGVSACHRDHARGLFAAAGPALRIGAWRGRAVMVCAGKRCVRVRLVDWCACDGGRSGRVIDLYGDAFRRLSPLSAGEVRVSVRW